MSNLIQDFSGLKEVVSDECKRALDIMIEKMSENDIGVMSCGGRISINAKGNKGAILPYCIVVGLGPNAVEVTKAMEGHKYFGEHMKKCEHNKK